MNRRDLLKAGLAAPLLPGLSGLAMAQGFPPIAPISAAERGARIEKAQALMRAAGLSALIVEPGAAMIYFTGVQWSRSERPTLALIPATGGIGMITPFFEEPSVRESLGVPADLRTWQEDESPFAVAAGFLRDRKATARIGIEETVRFFIADGFGRALPGTEVVPGAPIARQCRMIKSPAEIALLQRASDITIAAYRTTHGQIAKGMTRDEVSAIMMREMRRLGGKPEFALVLVGEASAYPHGTAKPQIVAEGEVVLMDCGCSVDGYQSDISRSFVFGTPNAEQRRVWGIMRRGQDIVLATARIGTPAGAVDDAVRAYYESEGFGPRYRLPGLSHRTGHGIGLDGHEPVNLVHGETTPLAPGMCFSNEPGIYIPGKFGIRLEDCFYMTEAGPRWFSTPPVSIDKPV